ncbi:MAG: amidohydrolase family protein [Bacteroidales bacterium]|nr:amidohydrolase family protein [Bacteroidales bacterium]
MSRIAAKYIYTLQDAEPIREGYVEYSEDGTITQVGRCADLDSEPNKFDGAIVPGFVNSHCHVELSHLEGKFYKGSGMAGFIDQINALRDCVSAEEKKALLKRQMDKMWAAGVSAMADISNDSNSFETKRSSPMYTRTFIEVFGSEPRDCEAVIASARALEAEANSYGIDASITPHSCYTTSPQLVTAAAAEGLRTGFISYHSQESRQEEDMIRYGRGEMYDNRIRSGMSVLPATGTSSLEYFLSRIAGLKDLPEGHILLVHNVCLTREPAEKALAMLPNVWWALCPLSNIFIHNALPPVRMMRELGLNLCIGTDSLSSNDELDMVGEIFCLQRSFPEIPLSELLEWACLNGARCLKKDSVLGSIAVGKRPGLVGVSDIDSDGRLTSESRSVRLV